MPRRLIGCLLVWLALAAPAFAQSSGSLLGLNVGAPPRASSGYTGPIDIVASPTAFYALRAGSAAIAAAGTQTLVNVRRASDNVACDFLVASNGGFGVTTATCNSSTQGGVSFGTFVGSDGTASCTLAGTTGACTGASGTVHVNDTVTGTGLTQPCIVASASNTAPTIEIAGTTTSCGTVGVAETFTFQVAGFVTEWYDQSGNGYNASQSTAASQPQLLPICQNSLSCLRFNGLSNILTPTIPSISQPITLEGVHAGLAASNNEVLRTVAPEFHYRYNSTTHFDIYAGTTVLQAAVTLAAWNVVFGVYNGASSSVNVNNSVISSGNAGTNGTSGGWSSNTGIGAYSGSEYFNGTLSELGMWPVAFSTTQETNVCHDAYLYWSTSVSC